MDSPPSGQEALLAPLPAALFGRADARRITTETHLKRGRTPPGALTPPSR